SGVSNFHTVSVATVSLSPRFVPVRAARRASASTLWRRRTHRHRTTWPPTRRSRGASGPRTTAASRCASPRPSALRRRLADLALLLASVPPALEDEPPEEPAAQGADHPDDDGRTDPRPGTLDLERVADERGDPQREERRHEADPAEDRGRVLARHVEDEGREDRLGHREHQDGDHEAGGVNGDAVEEARRHEEAHGGEDHVDREAQQEPDHAATVAPRHASRNQKYTSATPIGLSWACGGTCDADRYYDWEPTTTVPGGIDEESVLGVEAPLWSETVRGGDQLEYLLLPRAASVLETGWTAREDKDVDSFMQRLGDYGAHLTVQGRGYYESPRTTWAATSATADLDARTGATAVWPVGYVAAPGTKVAADGPRIEPDLTADDGDPASRSALTEPLTAEIVCPARPLPVTFTTDAPRDALHPAGVYTATVTAAFDADAACELVTSRGER